MGVHINGGDYKTILEMSMFGDPTLIIEDGKDPKNRSINRPLINEFLEIIADYVPRLERFLSKFF